MKFHLLTIFPEFFRGPLDHGVVARGVAAGLVEIKIHNLRDWTSDFHKTVDDRPFGGGEGMVLKPQPLFEAAAGGAHVGAWPAVHSADGPAAARVRRGAPDLRPL
jgi:tRNA (guanine37-N1)-methyltransferase